MRHRTRREPIERVKVGQQFYSRRQTVFTIVSIVRDGDEYVTASVSNDGNLSSSGRYRRGDYKRIIVDSLERLS